MGGIVPEVVPAGNQLQLTPAKRGDGFDCLQGQGKENYQHVMPSWVPDSNLVLFVSSLYHHGRIVDAQLAVLDLESGETRALGIVGTSPRYVLTETHRICLWQEHCCTIDSNGCWLRHSEPGDYWKRDSSPRRRHHTRRLATPVAGEWVQSLAARNSDLQPRQRHPFHKV